MLCSGAAFIKTILSNTRKRILLGESKYNVRRGVHDLYNYIIMMISFTGGGRMVIHFYSGSKCVLLIISAYITGEVLDYCVISCD